MSIVMHDRYQLQLTEGIDPYARKHLADYPQLNTFFKTEQDARACIPKMLYWVSFSVLVDQHDVEVVKVQTFHDSRRTRLWQAARRAMGSESLGLVFFFGLAVGVVIGVGVLLTWLTGGHVTPGMLTLTWVAPAAAFLLDGVYFISQLNYMMPAKIERKFDAEGMFAAFAKI